MNSLIVIEHLNTWGQQALRIGWQILWQSSLLVALMLAVEWTFGRRLRPAIRYGLWMMVLLKLILPPSLALPSGLAWWIRPQVQSVPAPHSLPVVVTYGPMAPTAPVPSPMDAPPAAVPGLSAAAYLLMATALVSFALLIALIYRWRQIALLATRARCHPIPSSTTELLEAARKTAGVRRHVRIAVVPNTMSPALFGLLRPAVLLPQSLMESLTTGRLRAVLVHELMHLRRGDVWVNCAQALLQILYWWHPLVWVANHRIRRVREEAVDEAVMLALREEAECYAPALLDVARMALRRPIVSLGLIGILESHGDLRRRIERLVDFSPPRKPRVTLASVFFAAVFGATALPMGQAPVAEADSLHVHSANKGTSQNSVEEAPKNQTDAQVLIKDGILLYQMGNLDEAEKKLILALKQNPREPAAYPYLNLVKEEKFKQTRPGGLRKTSPGRQRVLSKLDTLPRLTMNLDNVPLSEVVRKLAEVTRGELADPGINFIINPGSGGSGDPTGQATLDKVTISVSLTDVRVIELLDGIVRAAEKPIKYSIEDYGIVFSFKDPPALYTRVFKVDPNTFKSDLRSTAGKSDSADRENTVGLFRQFLASINLEIAPPKAIYWNESEGALFVRATLQDLDIIETALAVLNATPPHLNLKAYFLELSAAEEKAFWTNHPDSTLSSSGVRTLQLDPRQAKSLLESWKSSGKAHILGQSSITTLSGRQAQFQVVEIRTIVTYTNSPEPRLMTNQVPVGPMLDVLPTLSADTMRVDLAMTAKVGYVDAGQFSIGTKNGPERAQSPPLPSFWVRERTLAATVWDGQTLICGGSFNEQNEPAEKRGQSNKSLLVMVTPAVIGPAGNRLHTDEQVETSRKQYGK